MKKLILLLLLVAVSACSSLESVVIDYGKAAARKALRAAEYTICVATPVGAIREYYSDPKKLKAWQDLCSSVDDFSLEDDDAIPN